MIFEAPSKREMGGCATKPKVLKAEGASQAPEPAPEGAVKEEVVAAVLVDDQAKEKDVVVVAAADDEDEKKKKKIELAPEEEGVGDDKVKEIVDDDEQGSKHRSLSLLFKVRFKTFL